MYYLKLNQCYYIRRFNVRGIKIYSIPTLEAIFIFTEADQTLISSYF